MKILGIGKIIAAFGLIIFTISSHAAVNTYEVKGAIVMCAPLEEVKKNPGWYIEYEKKVNEDADLISTGLITELPIKTRGQQPKAQEGLHFVHEYITATPSTFDRKKTQVIQKCRVYYALEVLPQEKDTGEKSTEGGLVSDLPSESEEIDL